MAKHPPVPEPPEAVDTPTGFVGVQAGGALHRGRDPLVPGTQGIGHAMPGETAANQVRTVRLRVPRSMMHPMPPDRAIEHAPNI